MSKKLERAIALAVLAGALWVGMSGCAAKSTETTTQSGGANVESAQPSPLPSPSPAATDTSTTPH